MMEVLKDKLRTMVDKWQKEIEESKEKKTIIDICVVFEELFCRNIAHILLGEDVSDMTVEIDVRVSNDSSDFVRKSLKLSEAFHEN